MQKQCLFLLEMLKWRTLSSIGTGSLGSNAGDAPSDRCRADVPTGQRDGVSFAWLAREAKHLFIRYTHFYIHLEYFLTSSKHSDILQIASFLSSLSLFPAAPIKNRF